MLQGRRLLRCVATRRQWSEMLVGRRYTAIKRKGKAALSNKKLRFESLFNNLFPFFHSKRLAKSAFSYFMMLSQSLSHEKKVSLVRLNY